MAYEIQIQQNYGYGHGWEEVSSYPDTKQGRTDAHNDAAEYRLAHPQAATRVRRVRINCARCERPMEGECPRCGTGLCSDHQLPNGECCDPDDPDAPLHGQGVADD